MSQSGNAGAEEVLDSAGRGRDAAACDIFLVKWDVKI